MSASPQKPGPQDVQNAMGIVVAGVHKRAFLHKLAQLGHVPETEQEANELVALGFKLASLDPSIQEPNPFMAPPQSQPQGKYAQASADLDGLTGHEKQADLDGIYDAAISLAQDPAIYGAALTIKTAEALAARQGREEAEPATA